MWPVAWLVAASKGTPKAFKVPARLSLHCGLENRRTLIAFPGFESLVSRQNSYESPANAGLLCFWRSIIGQGFKLTVSASFKTLSATTVRSSINGSALRSHQHVYKPSRLSAYPCAQAGDWHRPGPIFHWLLLGGCRGTGIAGCSPQARRLPLR